METLLELTKKRDEGLLLGLPASEGTSVGQAEFRPSDQRSGHLCGFGGARLAGQGQGVVVVNDMTIAGYWLGNYYCPGRSRTVQYPLGWGTLGLRPAGVHWCRLAGDVPVLAVCGDGGLMFAVGELATIAQEQLAITVLLVDDGGYGMLRFGRDERRSSRSRGQTSLTPDFVKLAGLLGSSGPACRTWARRSSRPFDAP